VERHIVCISDEMRRQGIDITIIARRSSRKRPDIVYLDPAVGDANLLSKILNAMSYTLNVRRFISANQFDVVHIHGGIVGFIQSHLLHGRPKMVLTVHNLYLFSRNPIMRALAWLVESRSCKRVDGVIAVSRAMERMLTCKTGKACITNIPSGADLNPQHVRRAEIRAELDFSHSRVLLFVGRVIPEKGVHILVEAMKHLRKKYGADSPKLVIAGPPSSSFTRKPSSYFNAVMKLIHELDLEDSVRYMGLVERDFLERLFVAADVLVLPSISEAQGLVVLEAMAAGLPVVASATGGIPDMVHHEETGLLVPPGEPLALADAIRRVLTDSALARELSENGLKAARNEYSWLTVARNVVEFYKSLQPA